MDSGNILSILSALGGPPPAAPATNVLQAIAPPAVAPPPPPGIPADVPIAATPPPAAPPPVAPPPPGPKSDDKPEHPRKRLSVIDTIGRLADVFATVGGAQALYQPTLDGREDRTLMLGDHGRKVQADEIALATNKFALGDAQNLRMGQAARGLKAIAAAGGDINKAWPELAAQLQLDPTTTAAIGQELASNPDALEGLIAATTDPKFDQAKYSGNIVYGKDKEGNLVAFQPGMGNEGGRNVLPEGITPIDPVKFVDVGGAQVGYGTRSNKTVKILPKSARPDTIVNANTSRDNNIRTNATSRDNNIRTNAAKPNAAGGDNSAMIVTAQGNLNELRQIYNDLHKMGAMVSPAQAKNKNVVARIRASGIGQTLEGAVGTEAQTKRDRVASIRPSLMQSLAKATGMTGKQLDSNADVKLFMQTVTDPSKSYEANMDAIAGLERFLKANAKKPAAASPSPGKVRPKAQAGWSVVGVK